MLLEIQISSSLLLTSANKRQTFFTSLLLFGVIFFSESMLESFGCGLYTSAAYTQVFMVISNMDLVSYNSGSNHACNFKSASGFALVRFWNYSRDYSLNCTPLSPITITYGRHIVLLHCRRRYRAYAPTSNTAAHDNHEKINSWVSFCLYGYGAPLGRALLLWSIDTCQIKLSADQYHVTISQAQVYSSLRSRVLLKLTADQVLVFDWIASSCLVNLLKTEPGCSEAC